MFQVWILHLDAVFQLQHSTEHSGKRKPLRHKDCNTSFVKISVLLAFIYVSCKFNHRPVDFMMLVRMKCRPVGQNYLIASIDELTSFIKHNKA